MTTSAIKARLARLEAALCPPVQWVISWADDPVQPEYADLPVIALHWPEELNNGGAGDSSPLGIPKPY